MAPCALCGTHAPIERKMRQNLSDSSTISRVGGNQYRWITFVIIPIGTKRRIAKMMRCQPLAPARNDKPVETTIVSTPPFRLEEDGIRICAPHSSQLKLELLWIRPNACLSPQAGHFRAVFRSSGFGRTRTQLFLGAKHRVTGGHRNFTASPSRLMQRRPRKAPLFRLDAPVASAPLGQLVAGNEAVRQASRKPRKGGPLENGPSVLF